MIGMIGLFDYFCALTKVHTRYCMTSQLHCDCGGTSVSAGSNFSLLRSEWALDIGHISFNAVILRLLAQLS